MVIKRRVWEKFFQKAQVCETNVNRYIDTFTNECMEPWMINRLDEDFYQNLGVQSIDDRRAISEQYIRWHETTEKNKEMRRERWKMFFQEAGVSKTNINKYIDKFLHHEIRFSMLPSLNKDRLRKMEVQNIGDELSILRKISDPSDNKTLHNRNRKKTTLQRRKYWKHFFLETGVVSNKNLQKYTGNFIRHSIQPWMLPELDAERLQLMGIESIGDEINILKKIRELIQKYTDAID
ncbi:uncharacterized protein LOC135833991 isoform X2 [Planococcus citri]|uniref:uncharacterized protein LOC135833991 isoform X2 n=1 Tax=Planococcus citri TaxID=170843 RepID=UPI0031F9C279